MERYIVRIYRRSPTIPRAVVGDIENVAARHRTAFRTVTELGQLLAGRGGGPPRKRSVRFARLAPPTPQPRQPRSAHEGGLA